MVKYHTVVLIFFVSLCRHTNVPVIVCATKSPKTLKLPWHDYKMRFYICLFYYKCVFCDLIYYLCSIFLKVIWDYKWLTVYFCIILFQSVKQSKLIVFYKKNICNYCIQWFKNYKVFFLKILTCRRIKKIIYYNYAFTFAFLNISVLLWFNKLFVFDCFKGNFVIFF